MRLMSSFSIQQHIVYINRIVDNIIYDIYKSKFEQYKFESWPLIDYHR
jgi:hypothetical protein